MHCLLCAKFAGAGRVRGPQLRLTAAFSDREPRTTGPLDKVLGAICSAIVQIPLLCRLQSWSQAEAGPRAGCTWCWKQYGVRWRGSFDSLGSWARCSHRAVDGVAPAWLALGSVRGHPAILHSRYCSLSDPGQLKKTRNIPLDGIDLEQVWAAVSALRS